MKYLLIIIIFILTACSDKMDFCADNTTGNEIFSFETISETKWKYWAKSDGYAFTFIDSAYKFKIHDTVYFFTHKRK